MTSPCGSTFICSLGPGGVVGQLKLLIYASLCTGANPAPRETNFIPSIARNVQQQAKPLNQAAQPQYPAQYPALHYPNSRERPDASSKERWYSHIPPPLCISGLNSESARSPPRNNPCGETSRFPTANIGSPDKLHRLLAAFDAGHVGRRVWFDRDLG
jgi:hypothetical protein